MYSHTRPDQTTVSYSSPIRKLIDKLNSF